MKKKSIQIILFLFFGFTLILPSCIKSTSIETTSEPNQALDTEDLVIDDENVENLIEDEVSVDNASEIEYYSTPLDNFKQNNFFWFYKPPVYDGQIKYLIDHYSYFILTKNDEVMRDEVMSAKDSITIPEYILFNSIYKNEDCSSSPWQNQIAFHEDDFCWIVNEHPEWFLRSNEGKIIVDGNSVYIDPLADGWVDFFVERLHEAQTVFGWDGLFLDNLDASANRFSSKGVNIEHYPDDASYVSASVEFLRKLNETYIQPTGIEVYANITYLDFPTTIWREYLNYLDGFMLEDWAVNWSDGYQKPNEWLAKLEMVDESIKMGKKVFLVSQGNEADEAHLTFAYASYLLVARENVYFRYTDALAYNEIWDFDLFSKDLGSPTCDFYVKDNIYIREFTNGRVVVDPKSEVATITIFEE